MDLKDQSEVCSRRIVPDGVAVELPGSSKILSASLEVDVRRRPELERVPDD